MEEKSNSIWKDALKPSLILSLLLIIFSVIVYVFDLLTISLFAGAIISLLSLIIIFIGLIFLIKSYRNNKLNGFITYGKAFSFGIILGLYSSVILSAYSITFTKVIDPNYEKNMIIKMQEKTEQFMIEKGVPDDMIELQMEKMEQQTQKSTTKKLVSNFAGNLIFSIIAALIAAAIVKKNPDPYQEAIKDVE